MGVVINLKNNHLYFPVKKKMIFIFLLCIQTALETTSPDLTTETTTLPENNSTIGTEATSMSEDDLTTETTTEADVTTNAETTTESIVTSFDTSNTSANTFTGETTTLPENNSTIGTEATSMSEDDLTTETNTTSSYNDTIETTTEADVTTNAETTTESIVTTIPPEPSLSVSTSEVSLGDGYPVTIHVNYSEATPTALFAILQSANGSLVILNVTGTLEVANYSGYLTIYTNAFEDYGDYNVTVYLITEYYNVTAPLLIHYEEHISGLQIKRDMLYVGVNTDVIFDLNLTSGSNILLQCYSEENEIWTKHLDRQLSTEVVTRFTNAKTTNFTCKASNRIGSYSTSVTVFPINPIAGFSIMGYPSLVQTSENVTFNLSFDESTNLPMGNIHMNISFGDGESQLVPLGNLENFTSTQTIYAYDQQGNYTAIFNIYSEISNITLRHETFVWNPISVSLSAGLKEVKVNQEIQFYLYPSAPGFEYEIQYGDSKTKENPDGALYTSFNATKWMYSYSKPDEYLVQLTVWKPFYTTTSNFTVIVQHPIPEAYISLLPQEEEIPIPDGKINFTLTLVDSFPNPTKVYCNFEYGEEDKNISKEITTVNSQLTQIQYGIPVTKEFQYTTPGLKQVRFVCFNLVSNSTTTATVSVRDFKLQNFTIFVPNEVMMNMSILRPTEEGEKAIFFHDPVIVDFVVSLFNCSRLPPDIDIAWDFENGNNVSWSRLISGYSNHRFYERRFHKLHVHLRSADDNHTFEFQIKVGVVDFASSAYRGYLKISSELTFNASGPSEPCTYTINFDEDEYERKVTNTFNMLEKFTFTKMGQHYPYLIVQNDNFYEMIYLQKEITIDYDIDPIGFIFSNTSLLLPPGYVVINITIQQTTPTIRCVINMAEKLDKRERVIAKNISMNDPISFHFQYLSLGIHETFIYCTNLIDNITKSTTITTINKCFSYGGEIAGIFAWQFFEKHNPMIASTADEIDLSNRMSVECFQQNPYFDWKIDNASVSTRDNKGTFRFKRGSREPGNYKVTLNVTLDDTWCVEHMYIRFIRPSPFAWIKGGSERNVTKGNIIIDAYSESYSIEHGHGHAEVLGFAFRCYRSHHSNFGKIREEFADVIRNNSFTDAYTKKECGDGGFKLTSKGFASLNLDVLGETKGFLIIVEVSQINTTSSFFRQAISLSQDYQSFVEIKCEMNCKRKLAVQSQVKLKATCDEDETETLLYEWHIFRIGSDEAQEEVSLTKNQTETGTRKKIFVVNAGVFAEGTTYMFEVTVVSESGMPTGKDTLYVQTNLLPYGGNCSVSPLTGFGITTAFSVQCLNWKDEGQRDGRNVVDDANEPLKYEYIQEIPRMIHRSLVLTQSELFYGGENSATQLRLQIGDEAFDYNVTIVVRIKDMYGDVAENRNIQLQVYRNESFVPHDDVDIVPLQILFSTFQSIFYPLQGGGNKMALVQFVGSMTAMLSSINSSTDGRSVLDDEMLKKNYELLLTLNGAVSLDSSDALNAADTNNVMQKTRDCLRNLNIVNESSVDIGVETALELVNNLESLTRMRPFPVEDWQNILDGISGAIDIVDIAIGKLVPETTSLADPVTYENFAQDYEIANPINGTLTSAERAERQERIQSAYREILNTHGQINTRLESGQVNVSAYNMLAALEKALDILGNTILVGEPEIVIQKSNVIMTLVKTTLQRLFNLTQNTASFSMDFSNSTDNWNTTEELQIKTAVCNKIPQYHGGGASKLTSKGIMVDIKHLNGSRANLSMSMQISNEGVAFSKTYQPFYIKNGPDQMFYFTFHVPSENDAVIFYIRPETFNPFEYTSFALYDVYVRYNDIPSTSIFDWTYSMTIRDWVNTEYGFKVFVPENTLGTGRSFLALNPLTAPPPAEISNRLRRRRSADQNLTNQTTLSNTTRVFEPADVNFTMVIVTTGCRTWNENDQMWISTGCTVLPFSTLNETLCSCPGATGNMFATTFANSINFSTVWSKFDASNASVYGTLIAVVVLYIMVCIWARRRDRQDNEMWKTKFLCDSDSTDNSFYLLTIHTSMRRGSGTKSNVNFVVGSDDMDTGVRILSDGHKTGFPTGSVRTFIMGTFESLGNLQYIRIWHDNSGKGNTASWNLHKITIDDLQINKRYVFLCENWLSADHEDGQTVRTIPACTNEKLSEFNTLFPEYVRHGITEDHLWFSTFIRPERSSFSRFQRVSCILMLLFLTMITNAMFFKSESEETTSTAHVSVGIMRFSLSTVYISVFGILTTTVPVIVVTLLFTYSKQKSPKSRKTKHKYLADGRQNASFNDVMLYSMDHLPLPAFVRNIAWVIIALAVIASAFFLILFSMHWGPSKSQEWLLSFFLSAMSSVVFVDPMKVLFLAMVPIIICRKPFHNKAPKMNLKNVRELAMTMNGSKIRDLIYFRSSILSEDTSVDNATIRKVRIQHEKERKALQAFLETIFYIIFSYVIFSISYIDRDVRSYQFKTHLLDMMDPPKTGFKQIRDVQGFLRWLNGTFYQHYFPISYYNGKTLGVLDRLYISDLDNAKIGPSRLRLVRMVRGKCRKLVENRYCVPDYNIYDEDDRSYCVGWNDNTSSTCNSPYLYSMDAWRYQQSEDIWGTPITGDYGTYGGGGYILELENRLESSRLIGEELIRYRWINRETRAVFLEFTLYNANINLFVYMVFLTEFTGNGGLLTRVDVHPFRPYQHTGALGVYALICYLIYVFALLFGTIKLILKLKSDGFRCLRVSWNLVDMLCVVMSLVAVTVWVLRYIYTKHAMNLYYNNIESFINFNHVVIWDLVFNIISSILVFIANIRLLRLLGYNKRMSELASVISNAAADLLGFAIIFSIAFLAWAMCGYLIFGSQMYDYRSVFTAIGSLSNSLIGKNKLDIMIHASPTLAKLFYFSYVLFVMMILMTIFAVILNQSINTVRSDTAKRPNTFGMIDLLTKTVYALLGITKKKHTRSTFTTNSFNRYLPGSGSNPQLDTANIVRTIRDIFGDTWLSKAAVEECPRKENVDEEMAITVAPMLEERPQDNAMFRAFMPELFNAPITTTALLTNEKNLNTPMYLSYA